MYFDMNDLERALKEAEEYHTERHYPMFINRVEVFIYIIIAKLLFNICHKLNT